MGVYFGTTEITNVDWIPGSKDITQAFFGNTEIFSVWAEYDGTLPAQYIANGDYLADYRIYGSAGGVGDETINLFDANSNTGITDNAYINQQGAAVSNAAYYISGFMPVQPNSTYIWAFSVGTGSYHSAPTVALYNSSKVQIATVSHNPGVRSFYFTTPQNCEYIKASVYKNSKDTAMLTTGSTAPTSYIPYGCEVDMSVSDGTTSTTTPIYIGSDPLGEDEYVDYEEGKIYRRTNNKFNPEAYSASGYLREDCTTKDEATIWRISDYIPVIGGQAYTMVNVITSSPAYCWYNANKEYIAGAKYNAGNTYSNITATAPENAAFIRASYAWDGILSENAEIFMIVDGSTVPAEYEPYVAPENPPVPLPALPTVDGMTITDYAGQSAAVPSRFVAKYRKEGF